MRNLFFFLLLGVLSSVFADVYAAEDMFAFDLSSDATFYEEENRGGWSISHGGSVDTRFQYGFLQEKIYSSRVRVEGEFQGEKENFGFYCLGGIESDPAMYSWGENNSETARFFIRELYLSFSSEKIDLLLGQQIVSWGSADGINFLDLFNPNDIRDPVADVRTRSKLPISMIKLISKHFSPIIFEGILVPWGCVDERWPEYSSWTPHLLEDFRKHINDRMLLAEDDNVSGVEGGFKVATTIENWDVSFIYVNEYENSPLYFVKRNRECVRFEEYHPRTQNWGITFASGFDKGTFRGEFAWKPKKKLVSKYGDIIESNEFGTVLGVDYTFGVNIYINVQYFIKAFMDQKERIGVPRVQGFTFNLSDMFFDDSLEAGLKAVKYSEGIKGGIVQMYLTYHHDDNWKFNFSFYSWSGDENSVYGQYKDQDMFSLSAQYTF